MDDHYLTVIMAAYAVILYIIGLLYPKVASSGPSKWIGIRTGSNSDPKVWELMHLQAEVPTLSSAYFLFLLIYLFLHMNISLMGNHLIVVVFTQVPILFLVLVTAGENGMEGHTGLRIDKALESAESWKRVQGKALTVNTSFLLLFLGNFFFRKRDGAFRRMLVLGNMLVMSAIIGWYYFL